MKEFPSIYLKKLLIKALESKSLDFSDINIIIDIPDSIFGDYATNIAFILSKKLKLSPKKVALDIISVIKQLDEDKIFSDIYELKGFINFRLSKESLLNNLSNILKTKDLFGKSDKGKNKIVIVEYFQNNVAKPPHIGHLRSAVQGDCLLRLFRFLGFNAISDSHIGDWGTQFGILIYAFKILGNKETVEKNPITELNQLYVEMSNRIKADPELKEKGKAEFKKLEDGDPENRKLWQWFVAESLKDFEHYRKLLDLLPFDYNLGESFYERYMPEVIKEFQDKGLVTKGETGELYVDLSDYKLGYCILVKSDGATTYILRDFATYIYRKKEFHFYKNIYIVDCRQSHHFEQLFKVLELAGYPANEDSVHVSFGFMSLPEGAISTREGNVIALKDLLDEAVARSLKIIQEKNPSLEDKKDVAIKIARAAIKYFDLSHNRKSEIIFEWDKALSFEGNTGPYLQYTHARIHGILRKADSINLNLNSNKYSLDLKDQELNVLHKLQQFDEILQLSLNNYMPSYLCQYLFELSQIFNVFYQTLSVLREQNVQLRIFRLQLIMATAQIIKNGLYLLGIDALEAM